MDWTIRTSLLITALLLAGCGGPPEPVAAPDFTVERADAPIQKVRLSSLKGRVVLVDFWATWCSPCKVTMPGIERLYLKYKDQGLEVMAISNEPRAAVRAFRSESGLTYPFYVDVSLDAWRKAKIESIPRVLVVDRKGLVVYDQTGVSSEKDLEEAIVKAL